MVCKAIVVHKCQGMTIGPDEPIKWLIVHMDPTSSKFNPPGRNLVEFSRVTGWDRLMIKNDP